jgi:hypothetical protein
MLLSVVRDTDGFRAKTIFRENKWFTVVIGDHPTMFVEERPVQAAPSVLGQVPLIGSCLGHLEFLSSFHQLAEGRYACVATLLAAGIDSKGELATSPAEVRMLAGVSGGREVLAILGDPASPSTTVRLSNFKTINGREFAGTIVSQSTGAVGKGQKRYRYLKTEWTLISSSAVPEPADGRGVTYPFRQGAGSLADQAGVQRRVVSLVQERARRADIPASNAAGLVALGLVVIAFTGLGGRTLWKNRQRTR